MSEERENIEAKSRIVQITGRVSQSVFLGCKNKNYLKQERSTLGCEWQTL
ncbi:MAG: hypothetical protein IKQ20_09980 [Bacteroidales bacterium]|nr:hypothetical protein [Bacteroidales bacterium]